MNVCETLKMQESTRKLGSHQRKESGVSTGKPMKEQKVNPAQTQKQALAINLMEVICNRDNLNQAYKKVVSNKGSPGIDGMKTEDLSAWIRKHKGELITSLLEGNYKPKPVKKVMIPKAGGGERMLSIPSVIDRLVQQAVLQVLNPIIDPYFSEYSYGFRSGRSAHQALQTAQQYVNDGRVYVVDIDIRKFDVAIVWWTEKFVDYKKK